MVSRVTAVFLALAYVASAEKKCGNYDTIVVGMGASGVTAASELARAGRRVLGLEAMGRIGGRVHTVPCDDGALELGAEWIHGKEGSPTYKLAIDHDVAVYPQEMDREVVWSDGRVADMSLLLELQAAVVNGTEEAPPEPEPLGAYMTRRLLSYIRQNRPNLLNNKAFISEFISFIELLVVNEEAADSWNDTTTHAGYEELKGNHYYTWHEYGYNTVFEILLNTYNGGPGLPNLTIKLNTEVTKIIWPKDQKEGEVVVLTSDGGRYTADNVIVTPSVRVLEET